MSDVPTLVVFSHLRWQFVTQRPQHIMNRFSQSDKVVFVEEPIDETNDSDQDFKEFTINDNLTVLQPYTNKNQTHQQLAQNILNKFSQLKNQPPKIWFYSPSFVDVIDTLPHSTIIFDCMDELKAFKGASTELIDKEKRLLEIADVVFTGGKSLFEAKKVSNPNVYCYPSSVDRAHFEKSLADETIVPDDLANIPKPIVGFYGVLDERLDIDVLKNTAALLPNVSFVLIGPVVKIDPKSLPTASNIHYLGQKSYDELPAYLKGFNVAFMPFALNASTEFISPTKTLEFMAAKKPIVSSPIYDVKRDYADVVCIAGTAKEFAAGITEFITETDTHKQEREQREAAIITNTSWDKTVNQMQQNINSSMKGAS